MLVKDYKLPRTFWLLFIPIMFFTSYQNLFKYGTVQYYQMNELEDFGRVVFYLILSFAESIISVLFIWLVMSMVKRITKGGETHG